MTIIIVLCGFVAIVIGATAVVASSPLDGSREVSPPAASQYSAPVITCQAEVIRTPKPPVARAPKAPVPPDPKVEAARDAKAVRDYDVLAAKYTQVIDDLYDFGESVAERRRTQP